MHGLISFENLCLCSVVEVKLVVRRNHLLDDQTSPGQVRPITERDFADSSILIGQEISEG